MIVVIFAIAGLAVDASYFELMKQRAQSAADAAAMGGMQELQLGHTPGNAILAGKNDASLNGFTDGQNGTTVTINNPPSTGPNHANNGAVEAIVSRNVSTIFMNIFGERSVTVRARAVALTYSSGTGLSGCIYALDGSAQRSFQIAGSTSTTSACGAIVESTDNSAFEMEGAETFYLQNHARVGVVGGWQLNGQTQLWDTISNKQIQPNNTTSPGDPLAAVQAPTSGAIVSASPASYDMNRVPAGNKLQPGIYCGGLSVQNTGGATYTMMPGTFIIAGGGLTLNSQAQIAGSGVTIYLTSSTGWGCAGSYAYQPLTIDGQANVVLSAPTTGPFTGMLFFMDRSITDSRENKIVGGATTTFDGALYFKNALLTFSGNNSSNGYMVLVADMIKINGNSTFGNNYSSLDSSSNPFNPTHGGGLAE